MENIIIKWGSNEFEIDSNRTHDRYNQLISSFLGSELFSVNPYEAAEEELDDLLARRANNKGGYSWVENAGQFYSRCHLEKIIHVDGSFPWDQLYFQPWENFPVISMNRFRMEGSVFLYNERKILPISKKYGVLGCHEDTTQLSYFTHNQGKPFIKCYYFGMVDDYRERWCLRFAEDSFKRDALLLTQYFSINFLINHPFECFPVPYLCGANGGIQDFEAMDSLLSPILLKNQCHMVSIRERLREMVVSHHLHAEVF